MGWMTTNHIERMGMLALFGVLSFLAMTLCITQEPTQNLESRRTVSEACQISCELADNVRGLLLKEVEMGELQGAVKV